MNTDSELIERLREFGEHLSPVSEYYGSGIADILAAADRLEALSRALAEAERRLDLSNGHYEAWLDQIAMLVGMGSSSVPARGSGGAGEVVRVRAVRAGGGPVGRPWH
jgi:hypothetical protein